MTLIVEPAFDESFKGAAAAVVEFEGNRVYVAILADFVTEFDSTFRRAVAVSLAGLACIPERGFSMLRHRNRRSRKSVNFINSDS